MMEALTQSEINQLATTWYQNLDRHVPLEDYKPLLIEQGLELTFPEGKFTGFEGFTQWYEQVIRLFFDEVHTLKEVSLATVSEEKAEVKVVVNWQASRWNPPAANSERIILDAYQTWVIARSRLTQKPVIATYIVDSMEFAPNSAQL